MVLMLRICNLIWSHKVITPWKIGRQVVPILIKARKFVFLVWLNSCMYVWCQEFHACICMAGLFYLNNSIPPWKIIFFIIFLFFFFMLKKWYYNTCVEWWGRMPRVIPKMSSSLMRFNSWFESKRHSFYAGVSE